MTNDITYPVEFADEDKLRNSIKKILKLAEENPQSPEREVFDFKRELNFTNNDEKYEIRKDFSAFANTHGGWLIVGIAEKRDANGRVVGFEIVGLQNPPKDEQIGEILSASDYIRPPVNFQSRMITYKDEDMPKRILIYYIPEHPNLIEIKKSWGGIWKAYRRRGNRTNVMSEYEIIQKFCQGIIKLPSCRCVEPSRLRFYSCDESEGYPYIKWTMKNMDDIYKWIRLGWRPIIPIPIPMIPLKGHHRVYYTSSRWQGNYEKFLQILKDIENTLKEIYGIYFEIWTIYAPIGVKRWTDDHHYFTGCNIQSFLKCIEKEDLKNKLRVIKFAWILLCSVTVIVFGKLHDSGCSLEIESLFDFIPNQSPFISIDDTGRVKPLPLPAYEMNWWDKRLIKEWKMPIEGDELWREDIPDELLNPLPSAQIIGYLGDKPRPRSYEMPFREKRGFTLIDIKEQDKLPEDAPPLITNAKIDVKERNISFLSMRSAPRGLNDLKEVKLIEMNLKALSIPKIFVDDSILVLFSSECYVNQLNSYKLRKQ